MLWQCMEICEFFPPAIGENPPIQRGGFNGNGMGHILSSEVLIDFNRVACLSSVNGIVVE